MVQIAFVLFPLKLSVLECLMGLRPILLTPLLHKDLGRAVSSLTA